MSIKQINSKTDFEIPFSNIYDKGSVISDENPLRSNNSSLNRSKLFDKDVINQDTATKSSSKRDISPFAVKTNPLSKSNRKRNKGYNLLKSIIYFKKF